MATKQDSVEEKLSTCIENIKISSEDNQETVLTETIDPELVSKWPKVKPSKVPAIFLHKPATLDSHIDKILKQNIKIYQPRLGMLYTKIMCTTMNDHKLLVQYLDKNRLPYHTYGNPTKNKMKVVIKGLPTDIDLNKVKNELKAASIPIIRVHKMHTKTDTKLLVLAVVPNDDKGKTILKVTKLLGHKVILEPPNVKEKQCYRCQKWGHSQRYCHGQQKCVKCAGDHSYKKCDKIGKPDPPKCANCGEEHTSNYKQCRLSPFTVSYKLTMMFKKLRNKHGSNNTPEIVTTQNKKKLYKNFLYVEV